MGRRNLDLDLGVIKQLYYAGSTCKDIATRYGCSDVTIRNKLIACNIPRRNPGRKKFKYPKKPFSNDMIEKAYLIGFRIGDLNVFKY